MRFFLLALLLLGLAIISVAGFRGGLSRRPPIEVFPDMDRQPKLRPQTVNGFFADELSSQVAVPGTVARQAPYKDLPVNTGRLAGTTNFVAAIPVPVTAQLMARGRQQYAIHCSPCHGTLGDGKGITTMLGMTVIADLHDYKVRKLVQMPDGEIFNTITQGKGRMGAYGPNVPIEDRWAIIAHVRALQRSRLATLDDVPEPNQAPLKQ